MGMQRTYSNPDPHEEAYEKFQHILIVIKSD
jgi:hypothetical protein